MKQWLMAAGVSAAGCLVVVVFRRRQQVEATRREAAGRAAPAGFLRGRRDLVETLPKDHWARNAMPATASKFIGVLGVRDDVGEVREVLVFLKSAEGYATIATLANRSDPTAVLNRVPSQRDYEAVMLAATQVAGAFLRLGIFPALELLGNNSHAMGDDKVMELGTTEESFAPHVHIIGRGDPQRSYIADAPLRGLPPGQVMVPRQRHEEFASKEELKAVAQGIANSLKEVALHPSVYWLEQKR